MLLCLAVDVGGQLLDSSVNHVAEHSVERTGPESPVVAERKGEVGAGGTWRYSALHRPVRMLASVGLASFESHFVRRVGCHPHHAKPLRTAERTDLCAYGDHPRRTAVGFVRDGGLSFADEVDPVGVGRQVRNHIEEPLRASRGSDVDLSMHASILPPTPR